MNKVSLIIDDQEDGGVTVTININDDEFPASLDELKQKMSPAIQLAIIGYQAIKRAGQSPIQTIAEDRQS